MGMRSQKAITPNSQIAQDFFEQAEIFLQDVHKNAMQAYHKYKAYNDIQAKPSEFEERDYLYVLHLIADHQCSKRFFTDFR